MLTIDGWIDDDAEDDDSIGPNDHLPKPKYRDERYYDDLEREMEKCADDRRTADA